LLIILRAKLRQAILALLNLIGRESCYSSGIELSLAFPPVVTAQTSACRQSRQYVARGIAEIEQMLSEQNSSP
jgi:hypothetical protein